jgi:uracil-DNA glycosylase
MTFGSARLDAAYDRWRTDNGEVDCTICDGCEYDLEDGTCGKKKDPTTCKWEAKEAYLEEEAERRREQQMEALAEGE